MLNQDCIWRIQKLIPQLLKSAMPLQGTRIELKSANTIHILNDSHIPSCSLPLSFQPFWYGPASANVIGECICQNSLYWNHQDLDQLYWDKEHLECSILLLTRNIKWFLLLSVALLIAICAVVFLFVRKNASREMSMKGAYKWMSH